MVLCIQNFEKNVSDRLHADETGWRLDGVNAWLWSFSNQDVSVYTIDPTRSQGVVEEILGEVFNGVLCSDFYGAYHKIESAKQKYWAHILRDLKNLREKEPDNLISNNKLAYEVSGHTSFQILVLWPSDSSRNDCSNWSQLKIQLESDDLVHL